MNSNQTVKTEKDLTPKNLIWDKIINGKGILNLVLGEGAFSVVKLATSLTDNSDYMAVKIIRMDNEEVKKIAQRELEILDILDHPNVVKMRGKQKTMNNIYIFMEYCNQGNISKFCKEPNNLSNSESMKMMKEIIDGLSYLNQMNILHRDLKPENILKNNDKIKICDFGFARLIDFINEDPKLTSLGTPPYTSLEVFQGIKYTSKCDVYSCGIIFYELLYGRHPYTEIRSIKTALELGTILEAWQKLKDGPWTKDYAKILNINYNNNSQNPKYSGYPSGLIELIKGMIKIKDSERLSWPEVSKAFNKLLIPCNPLIDFSEISTDDSLNTECDKDDEFNPLLASIARFTEVVKNIAPENSTPTAKALKNKYENQKEIENDLKSMTRAEKAEDEFYSYYQSKIDMIMISFFALKNFHSLTPAERLPIKNGLRLALGVFFHKSIFKFLFELKQELLGINKKNKYKVDWEYFFQSKKFDKLIKDLTAKLNSLSQWEDAPVFQKEHLNHLLELKLGESYIKTLKDPKANFRTLNEITLNFVNEILNNLKPFFGVNSASKLTRTQKKSLALISFSLNVTVYTFPEDYPFKNIPNFKRDFENFKIMSDEMMINYILKYFIKKK